jgi:hypothetical protein
MAIAQYIALDANFGIPQQLTKKGRVGNAHPTYGV